MLEIGGVEPRGQDDDGGIGLVGGRGVARSAPQQVRGVVADRTHPVGGEQVREDPAMVRRFSITYETPDGERRLSSRTRKVPFASRTRSMPATWIAPRWAGDAGGLAVEVRRRT